MKKLLAWLKKMQEKHSYVDIWEIRIDLRRFWKWIIRRVQTPIRNKAQKITLEVHNSKHELGGKKDG